MYFENGLDLWREWFVYLIERVEELISVFDSELKLYYHDFKLAQKLEMMRQKKREYLESQRAATLARMAESQVKQSFSWNLIFLT